MLSIPASLFTDMADMEGTIRKKEILEIPAEGEWGPTGSLEIFNLEDLRTLSDISPNANNSIAATAIPQSGDKNAKPKAIKRKPGRPKKAAALTSEPKKKLASVLKQDIQVALQVPQPVADRGPPPPGRVWSERGQPVFAPGVSGGVKKVGSRLKLAHAFFKDTYALWEEQGDAILRRAAFHDPMSFAMMVAKLMPQKIEVSDTTLQDLDDDKLRAILNALPGLVAPDDRRPSDFAKEIDGRVVEEGGGEPAGLLSPLSEAD